MAGLEGELGTLLRVAMAGLSLFGVSIFFNGPLLLVLLLTCALLNHVLLI
jgi:hypothetical protein